MDQGQRLDAARAEFRAEWQAKVDGKRQQAEQARRCEERWNGSAATLLAVGIVLGGLLGIAMGGAPGHLVHLVLKAVIGAALGFLLALFPVLLALFGAAGSRSYADRLEREARELERS